MLKKLINIAVCSVSLLLASCAQAQVLPFYFTQSNSITLAGLSTNQVWPATNNAHLFDTTKSGSFFIEGNFLTAPTNANAVVAGINVSPDKKFWITNALFIIAPAIVGSTNFVGVTNIPTTSQYYGMPYYALNQLGNSNTSSATNISAGVVPH